jgi:site-specific recombinase XerD
MTTLDEQIDHYLRHLKSLNFSKLTIRTNRYNLNHLATWLAETGVYSVEKIRRRHLHNWQEALVGRLNGEGRPLKARSVNKQIEAVKGFLRYLVRQGAIPASLADEVHYIKQPQMLPGSVLVHEQVRRLLAAIETDTTSGFRDRALLELLYSSGIRAAELLGLDLGDVDLEGRTAVVLGKGSKQRVVPFGVTAAKFLRSYITVIRPHLLSPDSGPALFLDDNGNRLPYHTLRRLVHRRSEAAGIEINVTPHTFRRSCATELLRSGANMYHVKELLGHESLDTLKHYARLTITDLKKTHERCHPRDRKESQ